LIGSQREERGMMPQFIQDLGGEVGLCRIYRGRKGDRAVDFTSRALKSAERRYRWRPLSTCRREYEKD